MNKVFKLLIATSAILISQQNCLATDYDDNAPQANSGSQTPGGNDIGQLGIAIQQSSKISEKSKHINIVYKDGAIIMTGKVENDNDRQEIGNLAAKCGITNVRNELTIKQHKKAANSQTITTTTTTKP